MDWTTLLKRQQTDFIERLQLDSSILHCEQEGNHSELTVISGEKLKQLYSLGWDLVQKYQKKSAVNERYVDMMKVRLV